MRVFRWSSCSFSRRRLLTLVVAAWWLPQVAAADGWSRFRGPNGSGVIEASNLPTEFGPDHNVIWRTALPAGKSSPALTEDRIFLTGHEDGQLLTLCLDRKNGRELWRRPAPSVREEKMHQLNDPASSSPVTDGANVYVFFGGYGLLSYGPDGTERWRHPMGPFKNFHGMAASPILAGGKLVMVCDQDSVSFLIALDPETGQMAWRTDRPEMVHSFSTPVVFEPGDGAAQIIVPGSYQMVSYAAATGEKLWWARSLTYQVKSVPVISGDVLYFNGWAPGGMPSRRLVLPSFEEVIEKYDRDGDGLISQQEIPPDWMPGNWAMQDLDDDNMLGERDWSYYRARRTSTNSTLAIRLGGSGDVTSSHVLWRHQKSLPDVPSVLLYRGILYGVKNGGIVTALQPQTGSVLKQQRLREAIQAYYASPVAADSKVYLISEEGVATVLQAGPDLTPLAVNDLAESVFATPAISRGKLFVRTESHLYCFGDTSKAEKVQASN